MDQAHPRRVIAAVEEEAQQDQMVLANLEAQQLLMQVEVAEVMEVVYPRQVHQVITMVVQEEIVIMELQEV